jgi:hypothetical protein
VIDAGALVGPSRNVNPVASTIGWVRVWFGFLVFARHASSLLSTLQQNGTEEGHEP